MYGGYEGATTCLGEIPVTLIGVGRAALSGPVRGPLRPVRWSAGDGTCRPRQGLPVPNGDRRVRSPRRHRGGPARLHPPPQGHCGGPEPCGGKHVPGRAARLRPPAAPGKRPSRPKDEVLLGFEDFTARLLAWTRWSNTEHQPASLRPCEARLLFRRGRTIPPRCGTCRPRVCGRSLGGRRRAHADHPGHPLQETRLRGGVDEPTGRTPGPASSSGP